MKFLSPQALSRLNLRAQRTWVKSDVETAKVLIKGEVDRAAGSAPKARMRYALQELHRLDDNDTSPETLLRRYVFAVTALVHMERSGDPDEKLARDLVELCHSLLAHQGIRPRGSQLAGLYGDVHGVWGQIFRLQGDPWRAAWEQQTALQLAGKYPSGGLGFQLLATANRSLRLGLLELAAAQYQQSIDSGLTSVQEGRATLGLVQAFWLSGKRLEAAELTERLLAKPGLLPSIRKEATWIFHVRRYQNSGDINNLLALTRRGRSYFSPTYILEASLWALAQESRTGLPIIAKIHSLGRRKGFDLAGLEGVWHAARVIQGCYDTDVPLSLRIKNLGTILGQLGSILTLDRELLVVAASCRWLARAKSHSLAALLLSQYRQCSFAMSQGRTEDVLGILGDLLGRPWSSGLEGAKSAS